MRLYTQARTLALKHAILSSAFLGLILIISNPNNVFAIFNEVVSSNSDHPTTLGNTTWPPSLWIYAGAGILIAGLLGALVWFRNRLKGITAQLLQEKQTSCINRDIRNALQQRVNQLQRMESLGMLAGGVAHDFNNLLVGVMCNAEMLEMGDSLSEESKKERIRQIIAAAEKAADLSRQMLAYAGKQQIERKPTDVGKIPQAMEIVLAATTGEDIELTVEPCNESLFADVDSTQIEQIILNLVSNSRVAAKPGTKIIVRSGAESISEVRSDASLFGTRESGGDFVFIEVEDSGSGFPNNQMTEIFEPFYSTKEQGVGLGLSVVYGIINKHDGLIRVKNKPDQGAIVRFYLPRTESVPSTSAKSIMKKEDRNQSTDKTRGTILIVDDERTILDLTTALLETHGWDVITANDGDSALNVIQRNGNKIDGMVLDVVMPNKGAKEVLEILKLEKVNLPIVLMSGHSDQALEKYRLNNQVFSIVLKPFRTAEFVSVVEEAVRQRGFH